MAIASKDWSRQLVVESLNEVLALEGSGRRSLARTAKPVAAVGDLVSRGRLGLAYQARHRVPVVLTELDLDAADSVDAAIVAYPHGAAAPVVAELRGLGALVVDLSADFRLRELPEYERWYGPHGEPDLLEGVVYGLTELNRDAVRSAELVANPGCYPTAALLPLAPLAEAGLVAGVAVDA